MAESTDPNPYEPPTSASPGPELGREVPTRLPDELANRTKHVVAAFGLFQFIWPIAAAVVVDSLNLDLFAAFIALNGLGVRRTSFRKFPGTALMCCLYPVAFVASVIEYDPLAPRNWIPTRFSPVLALQLVSTVWAIYAITLILRCHLHHRRQKRMELRETGGE